MSESPFTPDNAYLQDLDGLQTKSFRLTLILIVVALQIALLAGDLSLRPLPTAFIAAGFDLMLFCAFSYWLYLRQPRLARYLFVAGLICGNVMAYLQFTIPAFIYLFAFICLFASILLSEVAAVATALICSAIVIVIGKPTGLGTVFSTVFLIWFAVFATFIAFRNLIEALQMAWNYQRYAIAQMVEAREHRAELMKLTKALQEARAELGLANVQLRYAYGAAEDARRLKALFAANVSHEFRTPINLIVGFCEMIVSAPQSYGEALPKAYYSDLKTVYECAKHLQSLISDVLDISQVEAGYMTVVKEYCDPGQSILEAVSLVSDLIKGAGLAFYVTIPDVLPQMWIDRTRIRQILLNLLGNAVRFTSQGSISLKVSSDSQHLTIAINDTGIGIRAEDIPHVFDEFYQAESLDYRRSEGSGLGLTLSKQFVSLHGGTLSVESSGVVGAGSTFTIKLPLDSHMNSQSPLPHHKKDAEGKTSFVMLTDDSAVIQLFERYITNHQVLPAQSIEEIVHLCQTVHPSAVVVGSEVEEAQIRSDLRDALTGDPDNIPVIVCPLPSGRREMQVQGADDYLVKPVTQQVLQTAVQRIRQPAHTVLVIDDDQDMVRLFSRMLHNMPEVHEVWKEYSGREGLALMKHQQPDLVILDVLMPDIDGMTTLQIMKDDPALRHIPVIIASASGAGEAIAPLTKGKLSIETDHGFQPLQLVRCLEAILDNVVPTISSVSTVDPTTAPAP